jgi:hypothetical protein
MEEIGDAPCCVLPQGRLLLGSIQSQQTSIYDSQTNTWTAAANKDDSSSEETWTLQPDETVLTAECGNHSKAAKYGTAADKCVSAGTSRRLGSGVLNRNRPGTAASRWAHVRDRCERHSALYMPPNLANQPGTGTAAPDFPLDMNGKLMEAKDAPVALMPDGKVLCVAGPTGESGSFPSPTQFFEFDGTSLASIPNPPNNGGPPFTGRTLLIRQDRCSSRRGRIRFSRTRLPAIRTHAGRRILPRVRRRIEAGRSYTLHGRQLNGLSQGSELRDDTTAGYELPAGAFLKLGDVIRTSFPKAELEHSRKSAERRKCTNRCAGLIPKLPRVRL